MYGSYRGHHETNHILEVIPYFQFYWGWVNFQKNFSWSLSLKLLEAKLHGARCTFPKKNLLNVCKFNKKKMCTIRFFFPVRACAYSTVSYDLQSIVIKKLDDVRGLRYRLFVFIYFFSAVVITNRSEPVVVEPYS